MLSWRFTKIYILQKQAIIILGVDLSVRSIFVFSKLKWMTVFERYFYLNCIVVNKLLINNKTPSYMIEPLNIKKLYFIFIKSKREQSY